LMMFAGQRTQLLIQHRGKNTLHDSMELCQGRSTMNPVFRLTCNCLNR
jgi:hypothetical protein